MSKLSSAFGLGLLFFFVSCEQQNPEKFAKEWTSKIKERILRESSSEKPDKVVMDTSRQEITFFSKGRILKSCYLVQKRGRLKSSLSQSDTAKVVYYSFDQDFQYVVEPCIDGQDRSSECVAYKGDRYGFCQFYYCKKKNIETGFQFRNTYFASWITYDSVGKIIQRVDAGDSKKLLQLKDIPNSEK